MLYKTTIVIWSRDNAVRQMELSELAREAEVGNAYCSRYRSEPVKMPADDPDWDGTEFFADPDGSAEEDEDGMEEDEDATGVADEEEEAEPHDVE